MGDHNCESKLITLLTAKSFETAVNKKNQYRVKKIINMNGNV